MIQRIQSIYLFIGMVIGIGSWVIDYSLPSMMLQVVYISTILLLLVAIFSYKNRRLQIFLSIIAGITFLVSQIYRALNFQIELQPLITGIGTIIFYTSIFFAVRNIQKDERTVKDINRLR
jgi:hypothetical protein